MTSTTDGTENTMSNDSPAPMSPADLAERLDALMSEYMEGAARCSTPRQASLRSPRASWCAVLSHAEHRIHQANRAASAPEGRA